MDDSVEALVSEQAKTNELLVTLLELQRESVEFRRELRELVGRDEKARRERDVQALRRNEWLRHLPPGGTLCRANPVEAIAYRIIEVMPKNAEGLTTLKLENGQNVNATAEMTARYQPIPGDFWVIQEDNYVYINPRSVFKRKYSPVGQWREQL